MDWGGTLTENDRVSRNTNKGKSRCIAMRIALIQVGILNRTKTTTMKKKNQSIASLPLPAYVVRLDESSSTVRVCVGTGP